MRSLELKYYRSLDKIKQQGLINYHLNSIIIIATLKDSDDEIFLKSAEDILKDKSNIMFI